MAAQQIELQRLERVGGDADIGERAEPGVDAVRRLVAARPRLDHRARGADAFACGVGQRDGDIAVGEGSVWVTSFEFPLSRIDPSTNAVVQQFYGKGGDAVRVGLGSVWLSNLEAHNVWRLDPRRIEATLPN